MITNKQYPAYRTERIIQQLDYLISIAFAYLGIIGSFGAYELGNISLAQMLIQVLVSAVLCRLFWRYGIRFAVRRVRKNRQAHRIFYHGNL